MHIGGEIELVWPWRKFDTHVGWHGSRRWFCSIYVSLVGTILNPVFE